jgi:hypothetical protein
MPSRCDHFGRRVGSLDAPARPVELRFITSETETATKVVSIGARQSGDRGDPLTKASSPVEAKQIAPAANFHKALTQVVGRQVLAAWTLRCDRSKDLCGRYLLQ